MSKPLPAKTFKDLIVWQHAHQLVIEVYKMTKEFPREEMYGITSQVRRAAVSVAANIAEAFKKRSPLDKVRILNIAQGSFSESQYFFLLAQDLKYADTNAVTKKSMDVARLLEAYIKSIGRKDQH
jgi:four helix bundle protein